MHIIFKLAGNGQLAFGTVAYGVVVVVDMKSPGNYFTIDSHTDFLFAEIIEWKSFDCKTPANCETLAAATGSTNKVFDSERWLNQCQKLRSLKRQLRSFVR